MKPSPQFAIRPLAEADCEVVADLLAGSRPEYTRFFHPFAFDAAAIGALVAKAVLDQWFMLEMCDGGGFAPAGFYMLRGLDEGFPDPMYGVFIAEKYAGRGLARLTLEHAKTQCRLHAWPCLRLKVAPENTRARRIYETAGFEQERVDAKSGQCVLVWRP